MSRISHSLGIALARIEPGSFLMGSTKNQVDHLAMLSGDFEWREDDEEPQHTVTITRPFYLGVHPVTQGECHAVMGKNLRTGAGI
jgi:formylglycine-generating enzyme required for sulfatase activity